MKRIKKCVFKHIFSLFPGGEGRGRAQDRGAAEDRPGGRDCRLHPGRVPEAGPPNAGGRGAQGTGYAGNLLFSDVGIWCNSIFEPIKGRAEAKVAVKNREHILTSKHFIQQYFTVVENTVVCLIKNKLMLKFFRVSLPTPL